MNRRIVSVDFFRFLFMLQICLWHLGKCMGIMNHGYIAVEFYFILSGYFIYKSSVKKNAKGVFDYTWDKIKRFYPKVLVATLPACIVYWITFDITILPLFNSVFFIHDIGLFGGGVNLPLWYLSVLLVGGGIVYALLNNNRHLTISVILPLSVLMIYTYILKENDGNLEMWATNCCFYMPLWRGVAGLSLGCLLARFYEIKRDFIAGKLWDLLFLLSLVGAIAIVFVDVNYDRYALLFYCIIILSCFTQGTIVNKLFYLPCWNYLGELSFEMLLVHMPIALSLIKVNTIWELPAYLMIILYITFVLLFSVLLQLIGKRINMQI